MKPGDLLALLQELHRDKAALVRRHQAGAARVSGYESNNTYQYVLAREDAHLAWLRSAIAELGAEPDEPTTVVALPAAGKGEAAARAVAEDDARTAGEFLARWQPRTAALTNARHRKMLELLLGEVAEHQRFFAQAAAGRLDLLGRRPEHAGTGGGVLSARWVE